MNILVYEYEIVTCSFKYFSIILGESEGWASRRGKHGHINSITFLASSSQKYVPEKKDLQFTIVLSVDYFLKLYAFFAPLHQERIFFSSFIASVTHITTWHQIKTRSNAAKQKGINPQKDLDLCLTPRTQLFICASRFNPNTNKIAPVRSLKKSSVLLLDCFSYANILFNNLKCSYLCLNNAFNFSE